jgi:transmembrane sensor
MKVDNKLNKDGLIADYLNEELSEEQINELLLWIKQSDANKKHFDQLLEIWLTSKASFDQFSRFDHKQGFDRFRNRVMKPLSQKSGRVIPLIRSIWAYAATVLLIISIYIIVSSTYGKRKDTVPVLNFNEITVPFGSRTQFVLSDGTKVTLNAGSKLRYDNNYGIENRFVELEGEGYFVVASDSEKPFIVRTTLVDIKAVGTEFNVKTYPGEKTIETTLVKGLVEVELVNNPEELKPVILKPDQKLTINYEDNISLTEVKDSIPDPRPEPETETQPKRITIINELNNLAPANVDVIPIISWKEKRWVIEDETLLQLAVELERRYDIQIEFKSESLKSFRFTGTLLDEPLEQVLKAISMTAPVKYNLEGRKVTFFKDDSRK